MIPVFFSRILQPIKFFEKAQYHMWKDTDPIPVFLFGDSPYPLLLFIMKEFSGGDSIQVKNYGYYYNHPPTSFIFLLSTTLAFSVKEGKYSRTELCVNPEFRETSTTCDDQFIIQKSFDWKESHGYL